MGKLTVNVAALESAVEKLTTLSNDVADARRTAAAAVPARASISTLTPTGKAGAFSVWIDEQVASPLTVVLDIARLLDTQGSGNVTYTYDGPYSADTLNADLGGLVATRLEDATSKKDIEKYLDIADDHADTPDFQDAFLTTLGPAGVATVLTQAGEARVPIDKVTGVFSADSQEEIAGWVRDDIVNPENIDTETTTLMAGFARAPQFSEALYSEVTPDQMADAVHHLNDTAFEYAYVDGPDKDAQELYSQFVNSAGTSFATYTHAVNDPEALADTWVDAITDDDNKDNASALTFLIRKGGENAEFDPDFLYNVTEDVYQWELDQDGAVWGPRDEGIQLWDPDTFDIDSTSSIDASRRSDGLANLLGSTGRTPEAAQRFFANGYEGDGTEGANSRINYLLQDRTFDGADGSDDGYGLGVALQSAGAGNTTHEYVPGIGYSDEWSAGFATDLFNHVAEHDQGGEDGIFDNKYHGLPGTSVAYGNIGAAYADDVYDMLDNDDYEPEGPTSLAINFETLDKVVGQIGHHDDMSGLESLSASLVVEGNDRFHTMLENNPGDHTLDSLEGLDPRGILDSNGEVLGKVLDIGLESKEYGEDLDQRRAEFASKAFDIGTSFVPGAGDVLSGVKDTLWETAIDTAKDEGIGALSEMIKGSADATSGQYADVQNSQFEDIIRYNTYDQLLSSGYLDDQNIPDALIVGEGDNRRFREDIRMDGVSGMPDPEEDGISDSEAQQRREDRTEAQRGINYMLTNDPDVHGPGASLQGLLTDALNGYDRVKPDGEG